jgi:hypothetical protein
MRAAPALSRALLPCAAARAPLLHRPGRHAACAAASGGAAQPATKAQQGKPQPANKAVEAAVTPKSVDFSRCALARTALFVHPLLRATGALP